MLAAESEGIRLHLSYTPLVQDIPCLISFQFAMLTLPCQVSVPPPTPGCSTSPRTADHASSSCAWMIKLRVSDWPSTWPGWARLRTTPRAYSSSLASKPSVWR
jgi:hypothetical protein